MILESLLLLTENWRNLSNMVMAKTAMEVWKLALKKIMENGVDFIDQDGRKCRQLINLTITIEDPENNLTEPIEWLTSFKTWRYPKLEEIADIMLTDKASLDYSYCYGSRIFNYRNTIDQVNDYIIPLLKKFPTSRRAIVGLLDPLQDSHITKSELPGLINLDFKMIDNKLHLTAILRSNYLFFGWPANIYQLFVLQDYVRNKLDCKLGSLAIFSVSAHLFEDQFELVEKLV